MGNKKEYILEEPCCANCAAKIESEINEEQSHDDKESFQLYILRLSLALVIAGIVSMIKLPYEWKTLTLLAAYLISGYDILLTAVKNITRGKVFDENFLMGFASIGAFVIGEQLEAITVLVFYGIGELLQDIAVQRSRKNIAGLMDIRPDYANLITGNDIKVVAPVQVRVDDIIMVKPGEKIPLDGTVIKGCSYIDTRALTGESVPAEVKEGDQVLSGSINTSGVLEVKVAKLFGESTVSKILELVQNAGSKKAQSEKFITKFARYYTPMVVFTAVGVALLPPLFGFGLFTTWIYRALSFLIISCPCALVISIPLSFLGGIGGAARQGILIKGGNFLDALNHVDTLVFDKTGTLTKGVFQVTQVAPAKGVEESQLLRLAASAEGHSTHPIAVSIMAYYNSKLSEDGNIADFQITEKSGFGIIACSADNNAVILAGNEKLMHEHGILFERPARSGSVVHVAFNSNYMGYILISDEIKQNVKESMGALKRLGVKHTVMLTGDHEGAAAEIAGLAGVDEFHAELLPQDKVELFEQFRSRRLEGGKLAFAGDGINDAPVLAGADIGIAMGGIGSDAAIEAADIVIMNDDIGKIVTAIKIAVKTRSIVAQNIIFALGTKLLIMLLSFSGITSIWFAIFADVGVALIALFNALRVLKVSN